MRKFFGATALALALLAAIPNAFGQQKLTLVEKDTVLGPLAENKDTRALSISTDYNHIAVLAQKGEKYIVTIDRVPGKEYEWVVARSLSFSADGKRSAYIVQQAGSMFAVIDGKEGKAYHEIAASNVIFAPVGARYAYYARPKPTGKWVVVIDGEESKEFDQVGNLIFSPDAKRLAFGVEQGGKQSFVIDNAVGGEKEYDKVAGNSFSWSPDGKRYAYGAVRDTKVLIVADGKESKPYTEASRPVFTLDSMHMLYAAVPEKDKAFIVFDDKPQKEYKQIISETIRISPDSKRLAYIASRKGDSGKDSMFYVIDGQETAAYEKLKGDGFIFSPDSKRTSFQCVKKDPQGKEKLIVVIDGLEGKECDEVKLAQFSPDSKHMAYIALRDRQVSVVVDGAEGRAYDGIANLLYNSDGSQLAYVALKGNKKNCLVLNGIEAKNDYAGIVPDNLSFSPDGKHLAYEARRETPFFVVDETETKPHAGSMRNSRLTWDSPTSFHALILRGEKEKEKEVVRLQVDLAGG